MAFLDVFMSRREDGTIQRKVYRKATWTGQYTNSNSFVRVRQKKNLVQCLLDRVVKMCSDDSTEEEKEFIFNTLLENGYPEQFICKHMIVSTKVGVPQTVDKNVSILLYLSKAIVMLKIQPGNSTQVLLPKPISQLDYVFGSSPHQFRVHS